MNVISELDVRDAFTRHGDVGRGGFPSARVGAAVGGAGGGRGRVGSRLDQLLPVPQQLLGTLGKVFIFRLLPYIIDQFS